MSSTKAVPARTVVGIQYARGVAALLVVFFHVAEQMAVDAVYGRSPHAVLRFGYVGVPIFFVISGFIIAVVSLDHKFAPRLSSRDFATKRLLRIVPFMWLAIVMYNVASFAGTLKVEWAAAVRAMILWPAGSVKPNVIWTLRHEAIFYALFAICFLGERRNIWLMALWCLAPAIVFVVQPEFLSSHDAQAAPSFFQLLLANVNIMFGAGLLLGLHTLRSASQMRPTWRGGAKVVYLGGGLVLTVAWLMGWRSGFSAFVAVTVLSTALIYAAIKVAPSHSPFDRLADLLGNASYAIYLVHNIIIVPSLIVGHRIVEKAGIWPLFFAISMAAIVAGVLAHIYIEAPLVAVINRKIRPGAHAHVQPPAKEVA